MDTIQLTVKPSKSRSKDDISRTSFSRSISGSCNLKEKDTVVSINPGHKKCIFTRTQVCVVAIAFLFLSSVIIVLVAYRNQGLNAGYTQYITKVKGEGEGQNNCACQMTEDIDMVNSVVENGKLKPSYIASDDERTSLLSNKHHPEFDVHIRLPVDIIPSHYDLDLDIYVELERYKGSVKMHVNVTKETSLVRFHVKPYLIHILENEIYIFKPEHYTNEKGLDKVSAVIVSHYIDFDKEIYALKLKSPLPVGRYVIYIRKFEGLILDDLKGIYLCRYKTSDGVARYVLN